MPAGRDATRDLEAGTDPIHVGGDIGEAIATAGKKIIRGAIAIVSPLKKAITDWIEAWESEVRAHDAVEQCSEEVVATLIEEAAQAAATRKADLSGEATRTAQRTQAAVEKCTEEVVATLIEEAVTIEEAVMQRIEDQARGLAIELSAHVWDSPRRRRQSRTTVPSVPTVVTDPTSSGSPDERIKQIRKHWMDCDRQQRQQSRVPLHQPGDPRRSIACQQHVHLHIETAMPSRSVGRVNIERRGAPSPLSQVAGVDETDEASFQSVTGELSDASQRVLMPVLVPDAFEDDEERYYLALSA